jgi:hypothetical protein
MTTLCISSHSVTVGNTEGKVARLRRPSAAGAFPFLLRQFGHVGHTLDTLCDDRAAAPPSLTRCDVTSRNRIGDG